MHLIDEEILECPYYGAREMMRHVHRLGHQVERSLMREHGLQAKQRRRYVVTIGSDHPGQFLADLTKDLVPDRLNQLWQADFVYVAVPGGFVYLATILDTWRARWSATPLAASQMLALLLRR
jgi:putative transposase